MKGWILAVVVGLFSFSAVAADAPAGDKAAKPAKATKKKDAPKKDDTAKKPEAK